MKYNDFLFIYDNIIDSRFLNKQDHLPHHETPIYYKLLDFSYKSFKKKSYMIELVSNNMKRMEDRIEKSIEFLSLK